MNNIKLISIIILVVIIIILILGLVGKKSHFSNLEVKLIKKNIIGTEILIPLATKWKSNRDDFKVRFLNHEIKTNTKLKSLVENISNTNVLDAGAHVGDTGLFLAKHLKDINKTDVKIIMIEPNKEKIKFINEVIRINNLENYTKVYNYAIGKKYEKGKIKKVGHSGMWTIEKCNNSDCDIEIDSLDNLLKGIKIGIMHLDVEGYEYEVLQGSTNILSKYKPKLIIEVIHSKKELLESILNNYKYKFKESLPPNDSFYE
jgi:FkbM family methyltransferase